MGKLENKTHAEVEILFKDFAHDFDKAEKSILKVKDYLNDYPTPATNQLRYAGFHISNALSSLRIDSTGVLIDAHQVFSARKHCLRAKYDAFDTAVIAVREVFDEIKGKYAQAMLSIYQEFQEVRRIEGEINDIVTLREISEEKYLEEAVSDIDKREFYYKLLNEKLDIVFDLYKLMPVMTSHLGVKLKEQEISEKKDRKKKFLTIIFAILSGFLGLCGIAFQDQLKVYGSETLSTLTKLFTHQ